MNLFAIESELSPHRASTIGLNYQFSPTRHKNDLIIEVLRHIDVGLMLLNQNLCVIFKNRQADDVLEQHPALKLDQFNRLRCASPAQEALLRQSLLRLTQADNMETTASLALLHEQRSHPLKLTILRLCPNDADTAIATEEAALIILLADPDRNLTLPKSYLQQAYGFTPAECEIAQILLNGGGITDIVKKRKTSENTARWQTKSLLQKTGAKNQAQLVRLLVTLSTHSPSFIE